MSVASSWHFISTYDNCGLYCRLGLELPVNVEITLMYFNDSKVANKQHVKAATH
jgi:hypothetical protein